MTKVMAFFFCMEGGNRAREADFAADSVRHSGGAAIDADGGHTGRRGGEQPDLDRQDSAKLQSVDRDNRKMKYRGRMISEDVVLPFLFRPYLALHLPKNKKVHRKYKNIW